MPSVAICKTMRRAGLVALLTSVAAVSLAQTPPPVAHVKLTLDAAKFLDSLADDAREHRIENAGCLLSYAVHDSVMVVERLGGATYHDADSVTIRTDSAHVEGICPRGVPTIHSHVAYGGNVPASEVDKTTARYRGTWNLLLNVLENGWLLRVY